MVGSSRVIGTFQPESNDDSEIQAILHLLDPVRGTYCAKCLGHKADGDILCANCASHCPDPDCRGDRLKNESDLMCGHCRHFMEGLDQEDGVPLIREGYFVYQLDSGYIGMTYNPSQRQKEHELRQSIEKRKNSGNPIRNPSAYIRSALVSEYAKHWEQVRRSDKRYNGERKIQWMSPKLESREEAFRCEWGLKALRTAPDFGKITRLSSVPVIRLNSSQLIYDSEKQRLLFQLEWKLFDDLGPSQIVPVKYYEVHYFDGEIDGYSGALYEIESSVSNTETISHSFELLSISGKVCRVRAINDVSVPGPWAEFRVSSARMQHAVRDLVGLSVVSCRLVNDDFNVGQVELRWSVANDVAGLSFKIERQIDGGDFSHIGTPAIGSNSFIDEVRRLDTSVRYGYRLRVNLFGSSRHYDIGQVTLLSVWDWIGIEAVSSGLVAGTSSEYRIKFFWRVSNYVEGLTFDIGRQIGDGEFSRIATLESGVGSFDVLRKDISVYWNSSIGVLAVIEELQRLDISIRYRYRLRANLLGVHSKSFIRDVWVRKFRPRDNVRLKANPVRTGIVRNDAPQDRYGLTMYDTGLMEWYSGDEIELSP